MARVVGLDYGLRKMGFAVSDPDGMVATPVSVERYEKPAEALRLVCDTCTRLGAEKLVIGLPLHMSGEESDLSKAARAFGDKLAGPLDLPIVFWDERLTSKAAESVLIEAGTRRKRRKEVIDKLAAQLMLQGYLDAQISFPPEPWGDE